MKHDSSRAVLLLGMLAVFLGATWRCADAAERWQGSCLVKFLGTSTLGKWSGEVQTQPFSVSVADPSRLAASAVKCTVKANSDELDTKNERRNKSMKEAMQTSLYPEITVRLADDFTMAQTKPVQDEGIVRPTVIPFLVEVLGKERTAQGVVKNCRVVEGLMTFDVEFPVSLKAWGIETPTVMGIIRVGDTIRICAQVSLATSSGTKGT